MAQKSRGELFLRRLRSLEGGGRRPSATTSADPPCQVPEIIEADLRRARLHRGRGCLRARDRPHGYAPNAAPMSGDGQSAPSCTGWFQGAAPRPVEEVTKARIGSLDLHASAPIRCKGEDCLEKLLGHLCPGSAWFRPWLRL